MKQYVACLSSDEDLEPLVQSDRSMTSLSVKGPCNLILNEVFCKVKYAEVLYTSKMKFHEAFAWCDLLGGVLVVLSDKKESNEVNITTEPLREECQNTW